MSQIDQIKRKKRLTWRTLSDSVERWKRFLATLMGATDILPILSICKDTKIHTSQKNTIINVERVIDLTHGSII